MTTSGIAPSETPSESAKAPSPPATTEVFPYEFYETVPKGVTLVLTTHYIDRKSVV